jgi:DNA-binding response OmpR family regulator
MKRLLLIDDEPAVLLPMIRYFTRKGFDVTSARDRDEALARLKGEAFDLVILDLRLGGAGADGLDVLRVVRALRPEPAVLVISGLLTPDLQAEVATLGAGGILQKPQLLLDIERVARLLIAEGVR